MKFRSQTPKMMYGTGRQRFVYWQYIPGERFVTDMPGFNKISEVTWSRNSDGSIVWYTGRNSMHHLRPSEWIMVSEESGQFFETTVTTKKSFNQSFRPDTVNLFGENIEVWRTGG